MKLTREMIEAHNPCTDGLRWYDKYGTDDLLTTLLKVNEYHPEWARWLFTRLMSRRQAIEIGVFCAEQVLHVYEASYPDDARPRKAIEAAKAVLVDDTEENRKAAADAAYTARSSAYAADAAYYAAYVTYATPAAIATNDAAYAAIAANATYAADASIQETIIREAVAILERGYK
jgi:hypothetical protein